jgi:sugar/nucleoside kinase (ribokinase family)
VSFDVVGIGENSVDTVLRVPGAVAPNAKLPIVSRRVSPGGQVTTTLATCASLGMTTAYIGVFGDDEEGATLREALEQHGVDTSHALTREVRNRSALILVDEQSGDRTVLWERDPRLALRPSELPREVIERTKLLHVDDVDPDAAITAARIARRAGAVVTSDLDRVADHTAALLAEVSVAIVAESLPSALTGEADAERALRALRRSYGCVLCVTLGARGSMMLIDHDLHRAPAFPVSVVDTTGAGDVFRGAFVFAMLRGDVPDEILRFANAAAAFSCTREGAQRRPGSLRRHRITAQASIARQITSSFRRLAQTIASDSIRPP